MRWWWEILMHKLMLFVLKLKKKLLNGMNHSQFNSIKCENSKERSNKTYHWLATQNYNYNFKRKTCQIIGKIPIDYWSIQNIQIDFQQICCFFHFFFQFSFMRFKLLIDWHTFQQFCYLSNVKKLNFFQPNEYSEKQRKKTIESSCC